MDIRGLEGALNSRQAERAQQHVIKGGAAFPKIESETFAPSRSDRPSGSASVVTQEEKDYFAALFPDSSEEIAAHATYSPKGLTGPARTGQMFDRKG